MFVESAIFADLIKRGWHFNDIPIYTMPMYLYTDLRALTVTSALNQVAIPRGLRVYVSSVHCDQGALQR